MALAVVAGVWWLTGGYSQADLIQPVSKQAVNPKISAYAFPILQERKYLPSEIEIVKQIEDKPQYTAFLFEFLSDGRKVSGQMNLPRGKVPERGWPVVIMVRGYVDEEIYQTGVGTKNAAAVFARNGYLTLAPDFLGYGESDKQDDDMLVARFERPVTILNLIASVGSLKEANKEKLGIWGHSNGGQIALSVLEISRRPIPTTLWAPVSQPFPSSVLYFVDEMSDRGEAIKKAVADFEANYNPTLYSVTAFLDQIEAPIRVHQGGEDESVPKEWSDDLVSRLKVAGKQVDYYIYPEADHNLRPNWNQAVERDVEFFDEHLGI